VASQVDEDVSLAAARQHGQEHLQSVKERVGERVTATVCLNEGGCDATPGDHNRGQKLRELSAEFLTVQNLPLREVDQGVYGACALIAVLRR